MMAEYIEREALLRDISESVVVTVRHGKPSSELRGVSKVIDRIKSAPTADVAVVVRCRDCKHFISEVCRHDFGMNVSWSDDFCSCGERKGESDGE